MQTPLFEEFNAKDADKDGKIDDQQAYELLKLLGKNVYSGTVRQAIKHLNYKNPEEKTITFQQFKEYFDSFETESKHSLWKYKYEVLFSIESILEEGKSSEGNLAAPGAGPGSQPPKQNPLEGNITFHVGPENTAYESHVEFELQKKVMQETKPFLKIVFEQSSSEKAQILSQKINELYKTTIEKVKGECPEYIDLIDSIHLIVNASDNKVNLFITTSNQLLTEIGQLVSEYFDRILGSPFDLYYHMKHDFNFNFEKFLETGSSYNFYEAFTKNTKTNIKWRATNFKNAAKSLLKAHKAFDELYYSKTDPPSLFLIGALHADLCDIQMTFDNSDMQNGELQSKGFLLATIKEILGGLQEAQISIKGVVENIENKITIEASLGNWRVKQNLSVKGLNKLFLAELGEEVGNLDDYLDSD